MLKVLFLFFILAGIGLIGGLGTTPKHIASTGPNANQAVNSSSLAVDSLGHAAGDKKTLQLKTVTYSSSTTPTNPPRPTDPLSCGHDHQKTDACSCIPPETHDSWACTITVEQYNRYTTERCPGDGFVQPGGYPDTNYYCVYSEDRPGFNKNLVDSSWCGTFCYGKPVIYLYPLVPTTVDVTLTIPGRVTISDPIYPEGGWKNVLAFPGGKLEYQGKEYHELYYESEVSKHIIPQTGIFIPKTMLEKYLREYTSRLGLVKAEQDEFIDYWLPKLNNVSANYIFFSVLTPGQKDSVDHVEITPKPDTMIEFLVYFKGINNLYPVVPLTFPTPPKRNGFTAVEWGGTIDK